MKYLLIGLLTLGSLSVFADTENTCSLECESDENIPKVAEVYTDALNVLTHEYVLFNAISINPRSKIYSTYSESCVVFDKQGNEFYSKEYAGTYLAEYYESQYDEKRLGERSNSRKERREQEMKEIMSEKLEECNTNY